MSEGNGSGVEFEQAFKNHSPNIEQEPIEPNGLGLENPLVAKFFAQADQEQRNRALNEKLRGKNQTPVAPIPRHGEIRTVPERQLNPLTGKDSDLTSHEDKESNNDADRRGVHRRKRTMRRKHAYIEAAKLPLDSNINRQKSVKEEEHIPDRPPEIDTLIERKFLEKVDEIGNRIENDANKVTLDDLASMITAETEDELTKKESVDKLRPAIRVAKEYLRRHINIKKNIGKVNVTVEQDKKGEWVAVPKAEPGKQHFTFTRGRIIETNNKIKFYDSNLNCLKYAGEALQKMMKGKRIDVTSHDAQALYTYIRENEGSFSRVINETEDPEVAKKLKLSKDMFSALLTKVNSYSREMTPKE